MKKDDKVTGKGTRTKNPAKKFERLIDKFKEKAPLHYKMTGSFNKDDIIDHDTFGKGLVLDSYNKRIDVIFSDKIRTLVQQSEIILSRT